jgi:capsular exopolysaccharide synthesis family protein
MQNDNNPFSFDENTIDFKAYFYKIISYWKLFLLSLLVALFIANYITKRKAKKYKLDTIITVKEEQNPLFNSSTNILFNWGGASDEVETIITTLQSRKHNEKVVNKLQLFIDYFKQGKYRLNDIYGESPFVIEIDSTAYQIIDVPIELSFLNNNKVKISIDFEGMDKITLQNFSTKDKKKITPENQKFEKVFDLNDRIKSDYFNFIIRLKGNKNPSNKTYYIKFNDYYGTVKKFQTVKVKNLKKGTSIISLEYVDTNKKKIESYLNNSVKILNEDQKKQKIQYAVRTKKYIDTLFRESSKSLKNIESKLGNYKEKNKIYDLSVEGQSIYTQVSVLDKEKVDVQDRLAYYQNLKKYINDKNKLTSIPAPAIISAEDPSLAKNVSQLIGLYKAKEILEKSVTSDFPELKRIINDIKATKSIILENISSLENAMKVKLKSIENQLSKSNYKLKKLPKKEQGLIKFQRNYNITVANYEYLKQKQYEAGAAIAANVSNIKILDTAKDTDEAPIYPKPIFNYLVAFLLGIILPLLYIIIKDLFDHKIHLVEEIEDKYTIPLIGVIGKNKSKDNLIVYNKPKATLSESFRAIRSNLQFLFQDDNLGKAKTILITSSVSGEGKTFTAENLAAVLAATGKKTVLVGFDLRKPKIHLDFDLENNEGLTNYLIGQKSIDEIITPTKVQNLDVILSGPVPPNPSELILNKKTKKLIEYLQDNYDYVIMDTPPIGLVADAQELFKFADAIIYIIRQGYTLKGMPKDIEQKYKNGEVKNISFLLNEFEANNKYGYGYGYGYGNYNNGYHENDEKTSLLKRILKMFFKTK